MVQHIICGIDVGNTAVKAVIADINDQTGQPRIIGVGSAVSNGLRRGVVVDMEEVISSIGKSVKKAQTMAGVNIQYAYVSISGTHIKTQISRGVVAVSRADDEIVQSDIDRVIEAASTVSLPQNYEIIHVIPKNFIIDGQEIVRNPLGMKGIRLEVEVLLIEGLSPYIHNLTKCVQAIGIEVASLVYAPLASSKAILDKHQREYGVLLLDLGGGVTSMAIFYEGDILHTAVLPIGSRHVTNDLAIAFRTSIDNADKIKHIHGMLDVDNKISKKDEVDLSEFIEEESAIISKRQLIKIIDARISEIFEAIANELKKTTGTKVLPAGMVLVGGGANLVGIKDYTKKKLGLATKFADAYFMEGLSEQVTDPAFAVAIGLVMWGIEDVTVNGVNQGNNSNKLFKKIRAWFKNFMP